MRGDVQMTVGLVGDVTPGPTTPLRNTSRPNDGPTARRRPPRASLLKQSGFDREQEYDGGRVGFEGTRAVLVAAHSTLTGQHLAAYVDT